MLPRMAVCGRHGVWGVLPVDRVQAQTTARPVNDFLDSTGVNTHIDQGYAEAPYEALLKYTGIRNIRDGNRNLSRYITLHNNTIVTGTYPGVK